MTETPKLHLPLIQPSQAQKHITVNEAMSRLDGLMHLSIASRSVATPPSVTETGLCHYVPAGAVNEWSGQSGNIAISSNGGWIFVQPKLGWKAWIEDENTLSVYSGSGWINGAIAITSAQSASCFKILEFDQEIAPGVETETTINVPPGSMIFGVGARVIADITGTLTAWQIGSAGSANRFGDNIELSRGTAVQGILPRPATHSVNTALQLGAINGDFAGGVVRLAVHYYELLVPDL